MTRRLLIPLAAVAIAAAVALGLGLSARSDQETPSARLILDWFPNADHAGVYAALSKGSFEKAGIQIKPVVPIDPTASIKQVATGKAQFAVTYPLDLLLARGQGVPVVAVGALVTHPLNAVIARTDRHISRPRDLVGKTVGAAGAPSDRPLLDAVVRADGGDPSKVRVRNVGFDLAPALAAGKVDAVIGAYWNVEAIELKALGVPIRSFRLERNGVPDYDELVVITSESFAKTHPGWVTAFLTALGQGQRLARTDQPLAVQALLKANKDLKRSLLPKEVAAVAPLLDPPGGRPLVLSLAKWQHFATWARAKGLLPKPVSVKAAIRTDLMPAGT
jgi:putative hydroxymethylpyrimidine transport system substrate-binding protein